MAAAPVVGSSRSKGRVVWTVRYRVAGRVVVREFATRPDARAFAREVLLQQRGRG